MKSIMLWKMADIPQSKALLACVNLRITILDSREQADGREVTNIFPCIYSEAI